MIRDIVVSLSLGTLRDASGDFALSVATAVGAHLSGVAFAYEPIVGSMMLPVADASLLDAFRTGNRRAADRARQNFDDATRRSGVLADSTVIAATADDAAERFGQIARDFDLSIVPQAQPDGDIAETLVIEAALFGSGRPVLVVPYIQSTGLKLDRVMVCWDGSRSAARAVGDAMPLLRRAGAVEVVTIELGSGATR